MNGPESHSQKQNALNNRCQRVEKANETLRTENAKLKERLLALADWWENEYVTDDGWPLICANQLRAELKKVTR